MHIHTYICMHVYTYIYMCLCIYIRKVDFLGVMKSFSASWNDFFGVMKCRSASWNNFGVMKCISASWNDFCSVMSSKSASWKFIGVMKRFSRRHELKSGVMKLFRRHETIFSASWIKIWRHENISASWNHFFAVMKLFPRHESTFGVMKIIFPQACRFVSRVMKVRSAAIHPHMLSAVNTAWLGKKAHHTMMYKCLLIFILSCLHAELLFVLRIVTAVSIARTGCSICWQVVQFRTLCGGQTLSAGSVFGGL